MTYDLFASVEDLWLEDGWLIKPVLEPCDKWANVSEEHVKGLGMEGKEEAVTLEPSPN